MHQFYLKILLHLLSTDSYKSELIDRGYDVKLVTERELSEENYFDWEIEQDIFICKKIK